MSLRKYCLKYRRRPISCAPDARERLLSVKMIEALEVGDAGFERPDQAEVQHARQARGNDIAAATDQDGVAQLGQVQNGLGGPAHEGFRGRMKAEQIFDNVAQLADPVLGHEGRQAGGQMMVLQDGLDQGAVENGPGPRALRKPGLEEGGQFVGEKAGTASGLPGNGNAMNKAGFAAVSRLGLLEL